MLSSTYSIFTPIMAKTTTTKVTKKTIEDAKAISFADSVTQYEAIENAVAKDRVRADKKIAKKANKNNSQN